MVPPRIVSDVTSTNKNGGMEVNEISIKGIDFKKAVDKSKDVQNSISRKVKIPPSFGTNWNDMRSTDARRPVITEAKPAKALHVIVPPLQALPPKQYSSTKELPPFPNVFGSSIFNVSHATNLKQFQNLTPTIPHIIHQIWDSYEIPGIFKPWIKSVVDRHPHWEYWLWTLEDAECLLRTRYSADILQLYRSYPHVIYQSDFIRYFILYEFGGFYLDLDVEALKPMDFWTYKHQCVMSHENYEHSFILHKREKANLVNGIMGSRSKHPYFKVLQENLGTYHIKYPNSAINATGPFYVTYMYDKFKTMNESKTPENAITVIHPKYWLPKSDSAQTYTIMTVCRNRVATYSPAAKKTCSVLEKRFYKHAIPNDAFLDHKWEHVNIWKATKKQQDLFNLFDVVPNAKNVSSILKCL